jgi:biopolymer transport protein ExbD
VKQLDLSGGDMNVGFQIAPMIDVVFVIMLFFMVMAGAVKVERELNTKLPGTIETSKAVDFADEQIIAIQADGQVLLNDDPLDRPADRELPQLANTLGRLKQAGDAAKTPTVVTIVSDEAAKYSRTIDVLNALAAAGIESVSFTVAEEE